MPVVQHYAPVVVGDDITSRTITLERYVNNVLQSLTGATITFQLLRGDRVYLTKTGADTEITVVDAALGIVKFGPFETDTLKAADYNYVIRVDYADGLEITMVGGQCPIVPKDFSKYLTPAQ